MFRVMSGIFYKIRTYIGSGNIDIFYFSMKYLIGRKKGMTQRFLDDGSAVAVTVVEAGPCNVTAVKSKDKDGYEAHY